MFPSGAKYEGGFKRDCFHGRGTYTSKNTAITVKGSFERGFIFGTGTIYFPDGCRYTTIWPKDSDKGFTLCDAIAHVEQVWNQEHESKQVDKALMHIVDAQNIGNKQSKQNSLLKRSNRSLEFCSSIGTFVA